MSLFVKTTTGKGLRVTCCLDRRKFATDRKVPAQEIKPANLKRNAFPGELQHTIAPRPKAGLLCVYLNAAE